MDYSMPTPGRSSASVTLCQSLLLTAALWYYSSVHFMDHFVLNNIPASANYKGNKPHLCLSVSPPPLGCHSLASQALLLSK